MQWVTAGQLTVIRLAILHLFLPFPLLLVPVAPVVTFEKGRFCIKASLQNAAEQTIC